MGRGEKTTERTGTTGEEGTTGGEKRGDTTNQGNENQRTIERGNRRYSTRKEGKSVVETSEENLVIPKPVEIESTTEDIKDVKIKPKSRRKSTPKQTGVNANDLSMLIAGTFGLISMKAGEHWQVSTDEADSIARPLENILRKMDLLEKVSNVSDGAMLVFACASITIPRVIISSQLAKQNKQVKTKGVVNNGQPNTIQESTQHSSNNDNNGIEESESLLRKSSNPLYAEPVE